jgi:DNA modification methylase
MVVFLERVNKILCGDALEILKGLPSKFVDMAMTSPPYWGLRNYGGETCKIWDGDIGCKHEWVESSVNYSQPHHGIGSKTMGIPCVTREALNTDFQGTKKNPQANRIILSEHGRHLRRQQMRKP